MSHRREVWTRALADACAAQDVALEQLAPGHWTAPGLRLSVRLTNDWLLFDAPLPECATRTLGRGWKALAANATLASAAKLCTTVDDGALRLRAEVPLVDEILAAPRVEQLLAGISAAAAWLVDVSNPCPPRAAPAFVAADVALERLCREAQWPFRVREPEKVMVELDVPRTFQQAAVEVHPER